MNAHTSTLRTAIALFVGLGSLVITAGPATALARRAVDGTAVIDTSRHASSPISAAANVAAGRITYR